MTNRNEMIQRLSLGTLVAAASLPVFVACATGSNSASGAASPSASAGAPPPQGQAPPPGYAQQPQPPPAGYPQQQPPPAGYPQQQPPPAGYPQQPVAGQPAPQQPASPPGATVGDPRCHGERRPDAGAPRIRRDDRPEPARGALRASRGGRTGTLCNSQARSRAIRRARPRGASGDSRQGGDAPGADCEGEPAGGGTQRVHGHDAAGDLLHASSASPRQGR